MSESCPPEQEVTFVDEHPSLRARMEAAEARLEELRVYVETDEFWIEKNRRWIRTELRSLLDGEVATAKELL